MREAAAQCSSAGSRHAWRAHWARLIRSAIAAVSLFAMSGLRAAAFEPVTIEGTPPLFALWQSAAADRRPAVMMLHGCGGLYVRGRLGRRYEEYARRFAAAGWHVLAPDSFGSRGAGSICAERERAVTVAMRRADVAHALAWLAARPDVDAARIALVGWSHGATTLLEVLSARIQPAPVAAVAFYPGCAALARRAAAPPATPLLLLLGAEDDWTPPAPCLALAERWRAAGANVEARVHAGSVHGFDGDRPVRLRTDIPGRPRGVHQGGNPTARAQAQQAMDSFLARMLK